MCRLNFAHTNTNKMKAKARMNALLIAITAVAAVVAVGCGGSSSDENKAKSAVEPTEETKVEASPDGVGRFAGKEVAAFDAALAEKGGTAFESKCAACHKLTADKVVGPGLLGVTKKRSAAWILNMITNPEEMTKQDPQAKALLAEHLIQMTNQNVSDEDALALLNFLRKNDEAK